MSEEMKNDEAKSSKTTNQEMANEANKAVREENPDLGQEASQPEEGSEDLSEKILQLEKDQLYLRAEMENIKRQNIKERSQLIKYGAERLAKDLLDTLDVFKSALESDVTQENFQEFVKGVQMTEQSLKSALEKHGITEVECLGQAFDPNTQEALSSLATNDFPEGHVAQVFKSPYKYHDKLLRAGQVVVSRAKTE